MAEAKLGPVAVVLPPIRLAPISVQATEQVVEAVKREHAEQVRLAASTAGGGTVRGSVDWQRGQLRASGYLGAARGKGVEAGGEIVFDLHKK